jgi:hypothetical protein
MHTPQVMKEMSAPAMSVDPTKIAVQFCVTQKPAAWQHSATGTQQHCPYAAGPFWLFCPQQQATAAAGGALAGAGPLAGEPCAAARLHVSTAALVPGSASSPHRMPRG